MIERSVHINLNKSWSELSGYTLNFQVEYWEQFLQKIDSKRMVLIDLVPRGSLRYKSPSKRKAELISRIHSVRPEYFTKAIPLLVGVDLPRELFEKAPCAEETSRYFILSESDIYVIAQYWNRLGKTTRFPHNSLQRRDALKNFVDYAAKSMPESLTKRYLEERRCQF